MDQKNYIELLPVPKFVSELIGLNYGDLFLPRRLLVIVSIELFGPLYPKCRFEDGSEQYGIDPWIGDSPELMLGTTSTLFRSKLEECFGPSETSVLFAYLNEFLTGATEKLELEAKL